MKFTELQKKGSAELEGELRKIELELMKYRAQVATGGAGKDAGKIRGLKRTVARIKTLARQGQQKEVQRKQ